MKQSILLLLLCSALFFLAACKDEQQSPSHPSSSLSAEEQLEAKYQAYRRSTAAFLGDFASRYRQINAQIQPGYDFTDFYYFSDDLQNLQNRLRQTLAMPGEHVLDKPAQDYLNAINVLLPLDKNLSDYSNNQGWLKDGGAAAGLLGRQLLPLLREAARAQRSFADALQQSEDNNLLTTLHKYPDGSLQKYRLSALYYARRIHRGFVAWFADYNSPNTIQKNHENLKIQLQSDIDAFDKTTKSYIANMPESSSCSIFMNTLVDLVGESRTILSNFNKGEYSVKSHAQKDTNTAFIRRNNDLLILKRHYLKVIESYNQGGC